MNLQEIFSNGSRDTTEKVHFSSIQMPAIIHRSRPELKPFVENLSRTRDTNFEERPTNVEF
jgi:hypothetical protein